LFAEPGGLEIIDGFKRVRAARALGWTTLIARIDDVSSRARAATTATVTHDGGNEYTTDPTIAAVATASSHVVIGRCSTSSWATY